MRISKSQGHGVNYLDYYVPYSRYVVVSSWYLEYVAYLSSSSFSSSSKVVLVEMYDVNESSARDLGVV